MAESQIGKEINFDLNKKRIWRIQALHDKQFKTKAGRKEKENVSLNY